MKVYMPIVDTDDNRKVYKEKTDAEKAAKEMYDEYVLDRPWLADKYGEEELIRIEELELVEKDTEEWRTLPEKY